MTTSIEDPADDRHDAVTRLMAENDRLRSEYRGWNAKLREQLGVSSDLPEDMQKKVSDLLYAVSQRVVQAVRYREPVHIEITDTLGVVESNDIGTGGFFISISAAPMLTTYPLKDVKYSGVIAPSRTPIIKEQ